MSYHWKYRSSAHRDCNINVKLNHKIPLVFHNLKNYDSHFTIQELGKFNLKINVIPNRLEKYMSFKIDNKLRFIDSFQFISSSWNCFVKNLGKNDFKYLSQEPDNNILDLAKQKVFYPYEYMSNFEKLKEQLPNKEQFHSSLTSKKIVIKIMNILFKVLKKFKMKMMKDYYDLYLKCDAFCYLIILRNLETVS